MVITAPHGAWRSPIDAALLTAGSVGLSVPRVDGDSLYWLESRATDGGRASLWTQGPEGAPRELTPDHYVRSTVHEYGGGAYAVADGLVVFTHFPTNVVHTVRAGEAPVAITDPSPRRYAGFAVAAHLGLVLAVGEDHSGDGEPTNALVALALDPTGASVARETVLVEGADFYDAPKLGPDGRVAWTEWDHPNMPWDTARVRAGRLEVTDGVPAIVDVVTVHDQPDVSAGRPQWFPDGRLCYVADSSGFWNFVVWNGSTSEPLHTLPHDVTGPAWTIGGGGYAVLDDDRILCTWFDDGIGRLGILADTTITPIDTPANTVRGIAAGDGRALFHLGFPDEPHSLQAYDFATGEWNLVRRSAEPIDPAYVSPAEPIRFGDPEAYAWFYPPRNPAFAAPEGELPPLRVLSHGGPTGFAPPELNLEIQYWTSRGYGVVDVNYGGSSGFGRAYRERLKGKWGFVDVDDCVAAARHLVDRGLVDPERIMIEGGSAGGYTTLRALTSTDAFAAGVSYFGIGDLEALARDTHKFESRYLDPLVAGPDGVPDYADRSPIHHLDRLATPMLILQGTEDKVVPPAQAEQMADAVRAKGLPVALIMFEGEAHGFRRADSVQRSLEATQSFLGQLFGFTPADEIEPLKIENLTDPQK
ncbi:alpha/beta hydrolase family protein [Mariniluteicoccus flavus]